jgi:phosphoglycerate dehydrogenase-like enzyme
MARKRGFIDRDIQPHERFFERVGDEIDLTVGVGDGEDETIDALSNADVAFVTSRIPFSRRVLEATDLEIVAKLGTGISNIDLDAAEELGVTVTHTPGINAMSVAEHALGLLLSARRHTVAGHETVEAGGWRDDVPRGSLLTGTTVGIVGFGNIGRRVASLLRGFDVDLLAYDPYVDSIDGEPVHAELVALDSLLERSDSVMVHPELTDETRGMIGDDAFARMRDDAVLVNAARGPVVDEDALIRALEADRIAGAGLDVFVDEPLPSDSPLKAFGNVTMTPHIAGATDSARENGIDKLTENTLRLLGGKPVPSRYVAV